MSQMGKTNLKKIDRFAVRTPRLILAYMLILIGLRVSLSPFLEIDEAEMVGNTDFRLLYANSHPPLYNWLLRVVLEITSWNWALSCALVKYPLLGTYYLLIWDSARRLAGNTNALFAVCACAFLPQIMWMSVHTHTHSVLILAGGSMLIHAFVLLSEKKTWKRYLWLGVAMGVGALAKYNFYLFLISLLATVFFTRETRPILANRKAILSFVILLICVGPPLCIASTQVDQATERLSRLYVAENIPAIDLPVVGIDGLLDLLLKGVAWVALVLIVWEVAYRTSPLPSQHIPPIVRALGRGMFCGMLLLAVIIFAFDINKVSERYLTPLLMGIPLWLAVARPIQALWFPRFALGLFIASPIVWFCTSNFHAQRFVYPYEEMAQQLVANFENISEVTVVGGSLRPNLRQEAANMSLALGLPIKDIDDAGDGLKLIMWKGKGEMPERWAKHELKVISGPWILSGKTQNIQKKTITYTMAIVE